MWVTLPYEPGRHALAGSAATVQELARSATSRRCRSAPSTTRASRGRRCTTSSAGCSRPARERRAPNGAVRLLEAGGERAEAEIVGAEVLELMRDGVAAEDIAVLVRGSGHGGAVRAGAGHLRHPGRVGAAGAAGADAARRRACWPARGRRSPAGMREDLLAWLRTPGVTEAGAADRGSSAPGAEAVDALDAWVRRHEVAGARERRGASAPWALPRLDAFAAAAAAGPEALLERARRRGRGDLGRAACAGARTCSTAEERDEARVAAELRVRRGRAARAANRRCSATPRSSSTRSARSRCAQGDETEGVLLADPLDIRARRFRAVFVCGLQDGEFPRRPVPEPFLDDEARRALSAAAGLRLPFHEDVLDRERSLFYACVSRPQEVLFLSWRVVGRGGRAARRVAVPRRRPRALHRRAVGAARAAGCWPR